MSATCDFIRDNAALNSALKKEPLSRGMGFVLSATPVRNGVFKSGGYNYIIGYSGSSPSLYRVDVENETKTSVSVISMNTFSANKCCYDNDGNIAIYSDSASFYNNITPQILFFNGSSMSAITVPWHQSWSSDNTANFHMFTNKGEMYLLEFYGYTAPYICIYKLDKNNKTFSLVSTVSDYSTFSHLNTSKHTSWQEDGDDTYIWGYSSSVYKFDGENLTVHGSIYTHFKGQLECPSTSNNRVFCYGTVYRQYATCDDELMRSSFYEVDLKELKVKQPIFSLVGQSYGYNLNVGLLDDRLFCVSYNTTTEFLV